MLGLKKGTVQLVGHDPRWATRFREIATTIIEHTGLSSARVQHTGSTAVSGLRAKPILDIVIGADDADAVNVVATQLSQLGYIDRGDGEGSIGRLLVQESAPNVRTIHVHIVRHASAEWRDYIAFRDALREDALLRNRYEVVKRDLAERFTSDREAYRSAKASFIRDALDALLV